MVKYKVKIDSNKCIGCGSCCAIEPKVFEFDDYQAKVIVEETDSPKIFEARDVCPQKAISIEEIKDRSKDKEKCNKKNSCNLSCADCGGCPLFDMGELSDSEIDKMIQFYDKKEKVKKAKKTKTKKKK